MANNQEGIQIKFESYTKQNNKAYYKPNEDFIHVVEKMYIVIILDGVSRDLENGIYPNPSPSLAVSEIFAMNTSRHLEQELKNYGIRPLDALKKAIEHGNSKICAYNKDFRHSFLPGTVGIISCIVDSVFYYGYIGDCIGTHNSTPFTTSQTTNIRANRHLYSSEEIRGIICNNIEHPCSYGVLNGQREALAFVTYGWIKLAPGDVLLMMSDGMENMFTCCELNSLHNYTCKEMVEIVEANERVSKDSDDKSILRLTI